MKTPHIRQALVLSAFALLGWGICGAIIGIGRSLTSMQNTLVNLHNRSPYKVNLGHDM